MWKLQKPPFRKFKKEKYSEIIKTFSFIYQIGDSQMLREESKRVEDTHSEDFQRKLAYVKRCLRRYRKLTSMGVGIAAVQVGIPERFAIIHVQKYEKKTFIIINPKITKQSKEQLLYPEMCMSAHPCIAPVARPAWIEFEYLDETGKKQYWKTKAESEAGKRLNRVFQHEIDHMNGIINIDLVQSKDIIFESDPKFYKTAEFVKVT